MLSLATTHRCICYETSCYSNKAGVPIIIDYTPAAAAIGSHKLILIIKEIDPLCTLIHNTLLRAAGAAAEVVFIFIFHFIYLFVSDMQYYYSP